MLLSEIISILNHEFPPGSILDGDRTGLQISGSDSVISRIMTAYELTDDVIDFAVLNEIELIVAFHPLIYFPLQQLNDEERVGRITRKLIKNDISLFVIHTNFDTHSLGTNFLIAEKLGLAERSIFVPPSEGLNNGIGIKGKLATEIDHNTLAEILNKEFKSPVKYCKGKSDMISTIAVLGGSGSSFLKNALTCGVDCYITADLTYHHFHSAKGHLSLFDIGHYEMEQFNSLQMKIILENLFSGQDIEIINCDIITNPVNYYPFASKY